MSKNNWFLPLMVVLAVIWFIITWLYISLEVYDVSQLKDWAFKILHFREKFIELALIVWMFAFGFSLGSCFCEEDENIIEKIPEKNIVKKVVEDDLKKIEGIGPKIEEVLKAWWIYTFKDLKSTSVTDIKLILAKWWKQFGLANPKTWPEQATMAHDEKWKELKEYQEFLLRGV